MLGTLPVGSEPVAAGGGSSAPSPSGAGSASATAVAIGASYNRATTRGISVSSATVVGGNDLYQGIGVASARLVAAGSPVSSATVVGIGVASARLVAAGSPPVKTASAASAMAITATPLGVLNVVIKDRLRITLGQAVLWHANISLIDDVLLKDAIKRVLPITLADSMQVSTSWVLRFAAQVIDRIEIPDSMTAQAAYHVFQSDTVRLIDVLKWVFAEYLTDHIQLAAEQTPIYMALASAIDTVMLSDSPAPQWILAGVVSDQFEIAEITSPQMLFSAALLDLIMVDVASADPGGGLSVWQLNTRTAAVTEYTNYPFNSFAKLTTGLYVGAAADGLYELNGPDDEGDPIIALLRGGYMQFGGPHLARLKEAYIAARGPGEWVLKIIDGNGTEYIYETQTHSMEPEKFWMGKGQRARYFAYELVSSGQDFDLDTLEFVPIAVQRRV